MMQVKYDGRFAAVEVQLPRPKGMPPRPVVVQKGDEVEVPDEVGKNLLAQGDEWKAVKGKPKSDEKGGEA